MENEDILKTIWKFKKKGSMFNNIHLLCGNITDAIIKYSLIKLSGDNVTCIFISFENFMNQMKNIDFEFSEKETICNFIGNEIDLNK